MKSELTAALENLDLALGIWRPSWLPEGTDPVTWRVAEQPEGFRPDERALTMVGPR
jgi:hypothetical protein